MERGRIQSPTLSEALMSQQPKLRHVKIWLCQPCIDGEGEECHTPGCVLFLHRVDLPIHEELIEDVEP